MQLAIVLLVIFWAGDAHANLPPIVSERGLQHAATPVEYMRELYRLMFTENGTSRSTEKSRPTDFWSITDKDVFRQISHDNQATAIRPCISGTQFTFGLAPMADTISTYPTELVNIYIRAYLNVEEKMVKENNKIKLMATVSLHDSKREVARVISTNYYTLSQPKDQWVEVDLEEEVRKIWTQVKHSTEMRVSIETRPEKCLNNGRSPVRIFNPADLPPEVAKPVNGSFQPLLMVFTRNNKHHPQAAVKENQHPRNKRSSAHTSANACSRQNHSITFSAIGLSEVFSPLMLNIYKCTGSCSDAVLREHLSIGTNHARIMSTIKYYQDYTSDRGRSITSDGPASTSCCVPTSYSDRTLLHRVKNDSGEYFYTHSYQELVVETCGCV